MTFEHFCESQCTSVAEASDGDRAANIAQVYLSRSRQTNDPTSQNRLIDQMRLDGLYFDREYGGNCLLRLRPYPI